MLYVITGKFKEAREVSKKIAELGTKDFDVPFKTVNVKSAVDMQNAVKNELNTADYIIMAAAVADYRIKNYSEQKIKKCNEETLTLELVKNPDILAQLCEEKNNLDKNPVIVGFCAESENLTQNAKEKLAKKGCDYLIANDISRHDIGFNSDENEVTIFSQDGAVKKISKAPKSVIARKILECMRNNEQIRNNKKNRKFCTT